MPSAYNPSALLQNGLDASAFQFWGSPVLTGIDGLLFCPGFSGATYFNDPWSTVRIGAPLVNPYTPGICEVRVDKNRAYDVKKAAGRDGATITLNGIETANVEFTIMIWTPEQLKALFNLWQFLFPPVDKTKATGKAANQKGNSGGVFNSKPVPFDVFHPKLSMHNIRTVFFTGASGPDLGGNAVKTRVFTIKAMEFLRPGSSQSVATTTPVAPLSTIYEADIVPTPGSDPKNTGPT